MPGSGGGTGEAQSVDARVGGETGADPGAVAGQQLQDVFGNPGLVQHRHRPRRDQRRLFGRLGHHRVAGGEGGGHLAGEDGQREVPGRDAGEHPAALPLGPPFGLGRVEAQEVHRLAHFADAVEPGLAGLPRRQCQPFADGVLVAIGGPAQAVGAFPGGACRPGRGGLPRSRQRGIDVLRRGHDHLADHVVGVGGIVHRHHRPGGRARGGRRCPPAVLPPRCPRPFQVVQVQRVGEVVAAGIPPPGAEQRRRPGDARVGDILAQRLHRGHRVGGNFPRTDRGVHHLVDEGAVGAVLQQPANQVGEQVAVRTDRCIDPAARALAAQHVVVQCLAHAVQALELEAVAVAGHVQYRGHGMRIVGGELRVDAVGHGEQLARTGQVGHVGGGLAGEHREAVQPEHLGALDLGIPVGALDQAHHDAAVEARGQRMQVVEHVAGALAIGLHHHAEAVPALQCRVGENRLDHVQRQVEAVGFLGVDVEAHAGRLGEQGQRAGPRGQFAEDAFALRPLVARMQGGELHRDAGVGADVRGGARRRQRGDGIGVGQVVAARVGIGARRFAEHVVGIGIALADPLLAPLHRFADGSAKHELAAQFLHRLAHRGADHRLAQATHRAAQGADQALLAIAEHLAGEQQRPGGGIDQRGTGATQVAAPVRGGDLVVDQGVDGFRVRHPQQGLGQAHQCHPFARGQAVLGEKGLHQAGVVGGTHRLDQRRGTVDDLAAGIGIEAGLAHQRGQHPGLPGQAVGADLVAKGLQTIIAGHGGLRLGSVEDGPHRSKRRLGRFPGIAQDRGIFHRTSRQNRE